jgi:diadenylate cyclase
MQNWPEIFLFVVRQIEIRDLVDLFLVWLVIYRALLLTKKSGAVQILSGLGVLAVIYVLSIWFELWTFNWLLELMFSNLFLIVAILFQGEIRRALAQLGSNPLYLSGNQVDTRHNLEEIASAAFDFAKKGVGALIVIEEEITVDYFIEQGTEVDCIISVEALTALFAPTSPVHDGAVLIRAGRIHSAGNFLPLTKATELDKKWGTRHRAALGLAEQTDALIVVVSEETRSVGWMQSGEFKIVDSEEQLLNLLFAKSGIRERRDVQIKPNVVGGSHGG